MLKHTFYGEEVKKVLFEYVKLILLFIIGTEAILIWLNATLQIVY